MTHISLVSFNNNKDGKSMTRAEAALTMYRYSIYLKMLKLLMDDRCDRNDSQLLCMPDRMKKKETNLLLKPLKVN